MGRFLHGLCGFGGRAVGSRRREVPSAVAGTGVESPLGDGRKGSGEEPLLPHKKVADWAPRKEVLGFDLDTERMAISLPGRKNNEQREMLQEWPEERSNAAVREVLVIAGKLHHVAYVTRPGRYFVRRILQLSKLHLNGQE